MHSRMTRFFFVAFLLAFLVAAMGCAPARENARPGDPHVVLVSFDGFRHDYPTRWNLPNFNLLARTGASVHGLLPSYPSKTFPNHYTLVTGLYPGRHGLVDNSFYNPDNGRHYRIGDRETVEDAAFYGGMPLWQHAQAHGLPAASLFWVGSEAPIGDTRPSLWRRYDESLPNVERIRVVEDWLALPDSERPRFITLYFSFVDSVAHATGPESAETEQAAREADRLLGLLLDMVARSPHAIDLVVVSDHGMYGVERDEESVIALDALGIGEDEAVIVNSQTQVLLYAREPAQAQPLYARLKAQEDAERFTVHRRDDTPAHWHYRGHPHVGDVLLAARPGYVFAPDAARGVPAGATPQYGVHGYDPAGVDDLWGILYAMGPQLRRGVELSPVDNVHVLPLLTALLGLPAPEGIDGDPEVLKRFLRD